MRSLTRVSLRAQAGAMLRGDIVAGELTPGEIYSAGMLAERMGVSATPVREAMLDLANAGLVEAVPNRGFRVLTVADGDLDQISELRLMIEVPAMALATERAEDAALSALEPVVDELEEASAAGDLPRFLRADRDFHLGLLACSGNERLVHLVAQLRDQTRLVGLKPLAESGKLVDIAREHRPILSAVMAREADRAQELMRVHLGNTRGAWAGTATG